MRRAERSGPKSIMLSLFFGPPCCTLRRCASLVHLRALCCSLHVTQSSAALGRWYYSRNPKGASLLLRYLLMQKWLLSGYNAERLLPLGLYYDDGQAEGSTCIKASSQRKPRGLHAETECLRAKCVQAKGCTRGSKWLQRWLTALGAKGTPTLGCHLSLSI